MAQIDYYWKILKELGKMAVSDWTIIGTGTYGLSTDTPSGNGHSLSISPVIHLMYNGNIELSNAEMVFWTKVGYTSTRGSIIIRNQGTTNINNCYVLNFTYTTGYFYRRISSVSTLLAQVTFPSYINSWRKMRMRIKNFTFTLEWWTGSSWIVILTCTDSSEQWASGSLGFGNYISGGYPVLFDDIDIGEELF